MGKSGCFGLRQGIAAGLFCTKDLAKFTGVIKASLKAGTLKKVFIVVLRLGAWYSLPGTSGDFRFGVPGRIRTLALTLVTSVSTVLRIPVRRKGRFL